jgi:hypothetical protein
MARCLVLSVTRVIPVVGHSLLNSPLEAMQQTCHLPGPLTCCDSTIFLFIYRGGGLIFMENMVGCIGKATGITTICWIKHRTFVQIVYAV